METIFYNQHQIQAHEQKRKMLKQKPLVVWMTGLSGSGKSTLASELEKCLLEQDFFPQWLDGDSLRSGLTKDLGFTEEDRMENIRRAAEVARLFCENGIVTICTFISPTIEIRELAKTIIGDADFREVYVSCPLQVCVQRDTKGLYNRALKGEIKNVSGVDAPYDAPVDPWLTLHTHHYSIEDCVEQLMKVLLPEITVA